MPPLSRLAPLAAVLAMAAVGPALAQTDAAAPAAPAAEAAPSVDAVAAEAILRATIGQLQAKTPDFTTMDPKLVEALKPNIDSLEGQLAALGPIKTLALKGPGPQGSWVFHATFETVALDCLIHFSPEKKIDGLFFKPVA